MYEAQSLMSLYRQEGWEVTAGFWRQTFVSTVIGLTMGYGAPVLSYFGLTADTAAGSTLVSPGASKPATQRRARRASKPASVSMIGIPHLLGPIQLLTDPTTLIV